MTRQDVTLRDQIGTQLGSHSGIYDASRYDLLTAAQAGEWLNLSSRQVQLAAQRGDLPCSWFGNRPMFMRASLERWLDDQTFREQTHVVVEDVPLPQAAVTPYQREDGRWSVRLMCPDGKERRFISRGREITQPKYQRERSRDMSAYIRYSVLTRDGYRCTYCGAAAPGVVLHVDHIVPVVAGGTNDLANLITACSDCNLGKGAR